jgi:DNA-binding NtrC family response regulator
MKGGISAMGPEKLPAPLVLVVDDEPLLRWSLSEELVDAGYRVCMAGTAADTRAALTSFRHDPLVVLLDIRLPDMSDLGLLMEIRGTHPNVSVIVMSAHASHEDARDARALGASAFLDKPFDMRTLFRTLESTPQFSTPR